MAWAAKTPLGQQTGDILSLPRIGSLGRQCAGLCSVEATIEWFLRFLQPMSMQRVYKMKIQRLRPERARREAYRPD